MTIADCRRVICLLLLVVTTAVCKPRSLTLQQQQQHGDDHYSRSDHGVVAGAVGGDDGVSTTVATGHRQDVCAGHRCRPGRVCRSLGDDEAVCLCAEPDYCLRHSNNEPVCGSDRRWYPSHCELHRTACVTGVHLHAADNVALCDRDGNDINGDSAKTPTSAADDVIAVTSPTHYVTVATVPTSDDCDSGDNDNVASPDVSSLMRYHCARIGYSNCLNNSQEYEMSAVLIFHYYDKNSDELLDASELDQVEQLNVDPLTAVCQVKRFIRTADEDGDEKLTVKEFKKALQVPSVTLDNEAALFHTTVASGSGLELKCAIQRASSIVWTRNGHVIDSSATTNSQFSTYADGSLYIHSVSLYHAGNYTCRDPRWNNIVQTHVIKVHVVPVVRVNPSTQVGVPGGTAHVQCYAVGRPAPSIDWQLNESPIASVNRWRYSLLDDNRLLLLHQLKYPSDTGAYKCRAQNEAGTSQDISTIFVEHSTSSSQRSNPDGADPYEVHLSFDDTGYAVFDPKHCHINRHFNADYDMTSTIRNAVFDSHMTRMTSSSRYQLCPLRVQGSQSLKDCVWGDAVNVRNTFVYVSQPELNRLLVLRIKDKHVPIEVIDTDARPVHLHYVESRDQLYVVCEGTRTVIVVRQASDDVKHSTVHVWTADGQPINGQVERLLLPAPNDLTMGSVDHGYATFVGRQEIAKLDLASLKYSRLIDLRPFDCQPDTAAFIAAGGRLIVQCAVGNGSREGRPCCVIVDYVTDHVTSCTTDELCGDIYVSPDIKYLVVARNKIQTVSINTVDDYGWPPQHLSDVNVGVNVSNIAFVTSLSDDDLLANDHVIAVAADVNRVIHIDLAAGQHDTLDGADWYNENDSWTDTYRRSRFLVASGPFGNHVMTPSVSGESLMVINNRDRIVQCEWRNMTHPVTAVWIEPLRI